MSVLKKKGYIGTSGNLKQEQEVNTKYRQQESDYCYN